MKNNDYTVVFKGTVGEDRKLTAEVTYKVIGDIVGKWNLMKHQKTWLLLFSNLQRIKAV